MRILIFVSLVTVATATMAQEPPPLLLGPDEEAGAVLPEITIGRRSLSDDAGYERCVDVEIGGSRAYNCLNDRIRRAVDKVAPTATVPPIDARSADVRLGIVNVPAVQQQYGRNFGVSVRPYRPPPASFTSPVTPR